MILYSCRNTPPRRKEAESIPHTLPLRICENERNSEVCIFCCRRESDCFGEIWNIAIHHSLRTSEIADALSKTKMPWCAMLLNRKYNTTTKIHAAKREGFCVNLSQLSEKKNFYLNILRIIYSSFFLLQEKRKKNIFNFSSTTTLATVIFTTNILYVHIRFKFLDNTRLNMICHLISTIWPMECVTISYID